MGRRLAAVAAAAGALLALAPAAGAAGSVTERDALERKAVSRLNAVRRSHGLRPLEVAPRLASAAERHAASMARRSYFRHELYTPERTADWTAFGRWIRWFWPGPGYSSWSAGENLAWGAPGIGARETVRRWLASPGHRANVLNAGWRHVAVAAVHVRRPRGDYGSWDDVTIVVAEFGRRR
ncbi:MAG TPA: CAP domain-containing protein [Gaiellaceae bacterium]|nr:CAP domain-containing protein [Gaiellaceae bacterium]